MKDAFNEASAALLGHKKSRKRDSWISDEEINISEERSEVKQNKLKKSLSESQAAALDYFWPKG